MSESTIKYERGDDGIVVLTLDDPEPVREHDERRTTSDSMGETVDRLATEVEAGDVKGVIITSAKKTFFAGGDLNNLIQGRPEDAAEIEAGTAVIKGQLRKLETLGVPVVACVNGAALGGGLEICLATHHRIVVDNPKIQLGSARGAARPAPRRRRRRPHGPHARPRQRADEGR